MVSYTRFDYSSVPEHRVVSETVSGSVEAMKRKEFKNLVEHKLEPGDTLVVSKLDRLGRDNIDVQNTVTNLSEQGVKLVCLDLPIPDLSSSEGKLMLQMVSSFAEFERNRIRERTQDGLRRAKKGFCAHFSEKSNESRQPFIDKGWQGWLVCQHPS